MIYAYHMKSVFICQTVRHLSSRNANKLLFFHFKDHFVHYLKYTITPAWKELFF